MNFKELHQQEKPLLICNVWDVASVKIAEKLNFQAIGTSSSAIATLLGYNDGEELEFSELLYIVKRILATTKLPLSVDLESGYSRDATKIIDYIKQLDGLGVVGINIEDSIVQDKREIIDENIFAATLFKIKNQLVKDGMTIFLNARTDTFILNSQNRIEETKKRIKLYEKAGADGIFVPCITKKEDIKEIVETTTLPINVMCMPNLPNFEDLKNIGVKRISMGNFLFDKMYQNLEETTKTIQKQNSFEVIF